MANKNWYRKNTILSRFATYRTRFDYYDAVNSIVYKNGIA